MSRTFRRKNYEAESGKGFGAFNSAYCDDVNWEERHSHPSIGNWGRIPIDKHLERKRWKQAWWSVHRESKSCNERSPGGYYKQGYEDALRTTTKEQLLKFAANRDHDVMIPIHPQDCWRDWS